MNKEDIYKIIGYQGEYTNSVKKAIRKLLKENHPDNKGNRDKFELINEVKQELENGKVPTKFQKKGTKTKKLDDIDYDYCYELIRSLLKKKSEYEEGYRGYKQELITLEEEYRKIYRNSVDLELNLLSSSKEAKKMQTVKISSIVILTIISILFILSLIKNSMVLLITFVLLTIVFILVIERYFLLVNDIARNNKKRIKEYVLTNGLIRENTIKREELNKKILEISKKLNSVENDLRFYNNLLK